MVFTCFYLQFSCKNVLILGIISLNSIKFHSLPLNSLVHIPLRRLPLCWSYINMAIWVFLHKTLLLNFHCWKTSLDRSMQARNRHFSVLRPSVSDDETWQQLPAVAGSLLFSNMYYFLGSWKDLGINGINEYFTTKAKGAENRNLLLWVRASYMLAKIVETETQAAASCSRCSGGEIDWNKHEESEWLRLLKCLFVQHVFLAKALVRTTWQQTSCRVATQDQVHLFQAGDVNQGIWDTLGGPDCRVAWGRFWVDCIPIYSNSH